MEESTTRDRLPRGQTLTRKWPVLTYGETPRLDLANWSFRCFGRIGAGAAGEDDRREGDGPSDRLRPMRMNQRHGG